MLKIFVKNLILKLGLRIKSNIMFSIKQRFIGFLEHHFGWIKNKFYYNINNKTLVMSLNYLVLDLYSIMPNNLNMYVVLFLTGSIYFYESPNQILNLASNVLCLGSISIILLQLLVLCILYIIVIKRKYTTFNKILNFILLGSLAISLILCLYAINELWIILINKTYSKIKEYILKVGTTPPPIEPKPDYFGKGGATGGPGGNGEGPSRLDTVPVKEERKEQGDVVWEELTKSHNRMMEFRKSEWENLSEDDQLVFFRESKLKLIKDTQILYKGGWSSPMYCNHVKKIKKQFLTSAQKEHNKNIQKAQNLRRRERRQELKEKAQNK